MNSPPQPLRTIATSAVKKASYIKRQHETCLLNFLLLNSHLFWPGRYNPPYE
jgi:hypothetical protein